MLARRSLVVASLSLVALTSAANAAVTADAVVGYVPGAGAKAAYWGAPLTDPATALGLPQPNHNVPDLFDAQNNQIAFADHSVLSPFNAAYTPDEVVSFGAGGSITLHLGAPVPTSGGRTLGVHTGTGLSAAFPSNGDNLPVAFTYTDDRVAVVEISADNVTWFSLGQVAFNMPSNYYSAGLTSAFENGPGTAVADFARPFAPASGLASFNNLNFADTLALLDGSGGGTWLDLSAATGPGALPASVQYVRFSLPARSPNSFVLDSLTAVPEPSALVPLAACLPVLLRRRK